MTRQDMAKLFVNSAKLDGANQAVFANQQSALL